MYKLTLYFENGGEYERIFISEQEAMIEHLYQSTERVIVDYELVNMDKGLH